MKSTLIAATAVLFVLAVGFTAMNRTEAQQLTPTPSPEAITRGEYLVKIMVCNDCHTPWKIGANGPEPDMTRMLSGHPEQIGRLPNLKPEEPYVFSGFPTNTAFSGPWGVSYTANLTPDQSTGLGIWTEEMFVQTIRTGRHMGVSRPINPPMPWQMYRNATDEDLKAIYAYLRTIKPIVNHVPEYQEPSESN